MNKNQPFDFRTYVKKHANDSSDQLMRDMFGGNMDDHEDYCEHFDECVKQGEKILDKIFTDQEFVALVLQATGSIVGDVMFKGNGKVDVSKLLQMGSSKEFMTIALYLFTYAIGLSNKEEIY